MRKLIMKYREWKRKRKAKKDNEIRQATIMFEYYKQYNRAMESIIDKILKENLDNINK